MASNLGDYLNTDLFNSSQSLQALEDYTRSVAGSPQQTQEPASSSQKPIDVYEPTPPVEPVYTKGFSGHINQFLSGFGDVLGSVPKAVGIAQGAITGTKPEETSLYKIGQDVIDSLDFSSQTAPEVRQSFAGQVSRGLGNLAGFLLGGATGQAIKGGTAAIPMALGAGQESAALYDEAKKAGATEGEAYSAALQGAGLGLTEGLPILNMFGRALGPELNGFTSALKNTALSVGEEGVQEALQTIGENAIAKYTAGYDKDRALMDSVVEAGGVGGVTGGIASLFLNTLGLKLRRLDNGKAFVETDQGFQIDPSSDLGQAYITARRQKSLIPDKVDLNQQLNPSTFEGFSNSDIAGAQYKLQKFADAPEGSIGNRVYNQQVKYLLDKYIANPASNDSRAVSEAMDVLSNLPGDRTYSEGELQRLSTEATTKKAEEKANIKDKGKPLTIDQEELPKLFRPEPDLINPQKSETKQIIDKAAIEENNKQANRHVSFTRDNETLDLNHSNYSPDELNQDVNIKVETDQGTFDTSIPFHEVLTESQRKVPVYNKLLECLG